MACKLACFPLLILALFWLTGCAYEIFPSAISSAESSPATRGATVPSAPRYFAYAMTGRAISEYALSSSTGELTTLSSSYLSLGASSLPFFAVPSADMRFLYVADWGANGVDVLSIDPASGSLSAVGSAVPGGTHPDCIAIDGARGLLFIANYTSNDVWSYRIDSTTGALTPVTQSMAAQSIPIAIALDTVGQHVYVANQGANSISIYRYDPTTGALTFIANQTGVSTPNGAAVDRASKYLYVPGQNAGLYVYQISGDNLVAVPPTPAAAAGGTWIAIDPSASFLMITNWVPKTLTSFAMASSGSVTQIGTAPTATNPYGVTVDPSGNFALVSNSGSNDISVYQIDATSGALTEVPGSPFPSANGAGGSGITAVVLK